MSILALTWMPDGSRGCTHDKNSSLSASVSTSHRFAMLLCFTTSDNLNTNWMSFAAPRNRKAFDEVDTNEFLACQKLHGMQALVAPVAPKVS